MNAVVRSCLALLLCAAVLSPAAWAVDAAPPFADPVLQQRYLDLTHELRCVQCQNGSIADSPVEIAAQLRREVHESIEAGRTDDEIREAMVSRYSEFVLFKPRWSGRSLLLWLLPGALLIVGAAVGFTIIRRRAQLLPVDDSAVDEEDRT